jgi:hypothetical protein
LWACSSAAERPAQVKKLYQNWQNSSNGLPGE